MRHALGRSSIKSRGVSPDAPWPEGVTMPSYPGTSRFGDIARWIQTIMTHAVCLLCLIIPPAVLAAPDGERPLTSEMATPADRAIRTAQAQVTDHPDRDEAHLSLATAYIRKVREA